MTGCQLLAALFVFTAVAHAEPRFTAMENNHPQIQASVVSSLRTALDVNRYSEVRVHVAGDHAVVYMSVKGLHRLELASVDLDRDGRAGQVHTGYHLTAADQPTLAEVSCPDPTVQFLSVAPNNDSFEQGIAEGVATAAEAKGLKTMRLYNPQATRQTYLNYMSCPNLVGNFYDGDANPQVIVTSDGTLSASDMSNLNGALRLKVTNIWLACEAFNDPMLSSVVKGAGAQKYAAGINDLEVGPSDQAAACAMKAAIAGQPMTAAFQGCLKQLDNASDQWGFTGNGADLFGE